MAVVCGGASLRKRPTRGTRHLCGLLPALEDAILPRVADITAARLEMSRY
jgi:hypothetical protein